MDEMDGGIRLVQTLYMNDGWNYRHAGEGGMFLDFRTVSRLPLAHSCRVLHNRGVRAKLTVRHEVGVLRSTSVKK
jgi:hypothetical protein